jgi:hypothetical protein
MKLKYFIVIASCIVLAQDEKMFSDFINHIDQEMGKIFNTYIAGNVQKPIAPFETLARELVTEKPWIFAAINRLLLQNKSLVYNVLGGNRERIEALNNNMPLIYPYYISQVGDQRNNTALVEQATLFFIHLFINTRILPFLYNNTEKKALDRHGFIITTIDEGTKKQANLSQLHNNLPKLMIELLNEKKPLLLLQKATLANYLYTILKPYFPNSVIYKTENQLSLFQKYVKDGLVSRTISDSLLDAIDNKAQEFGIREVIQWSNPQTIQEIIRSNIKADAPGAVFVKDDVPPVQTQREQLTWAGYLKRLMW